MCVYVLTKTFSISLALYTLHTKVNNKVSENFIPIDFRLKTVIFIVDGDDSFWVQWFSLFGYDNNMN